MAEDLVPWVAAGLIVGAIVLGLLIAGFLAWRSRANDATFRAACENARNWVQLATPTGRLVLGQTLIDGRLLTLEIQRGSAQHPTYVRLRAPVDMGAVDDRGIDQDSPTRAVTTAVTALFRPKTFADRLGEKLRLTPLLRTGNAALDARLHIETDASNEALEGVLGHKTAVEVLARLFDAGIDRVELLHGAPLITAVFRGPTPSEIASLPNLAANLSALAGVLPKLPPTAIGRYRHLRGLKLPLAILGVGGAAAIASFFLHDAVYIADPTAVDTLLQIGIVAWPPFGSQATSPSVNAAEPWATSCNPRSRSWSRHPHSRSPLASG